MKKKGLSIRKYGREQLYPNFYADIFSPNFQERQEFQISSDSVQRGYVIPKVNTEEEVSIDSFLDCFSDNKEDIKNFGDVLSEKRDSIIQDCRNIPTQYTEEENDKVHNHVKKALGCYRPNIKKPQCKMRASDSFVQKLADPQIDLQELSKQLPLPYGKIYILIEKLNTYQVPFIRAIWFIKITYNHRLRGNNKWSDPGQLSTDFTTDICKFLGTSLSSGITTPSNPSSSSSHQKSSKSNPNYTLNLSVKYALNLLSWCEDEGLIDPKVLINFVISMFQKDLLKSFIHQFFFSDNHQMMKTTNMKKKKTKKKTFRSLSNGIFPLRFFLWQYHRGYINNTTERVYHSFCRFFFFLICGGVFPQQQQQQQFQEEENEEEEEEEQEEIRGLGILNGTLIRNQKKRIKVLYAQRSGYIMQKIVDLLYRGCKPFYFRHLCESLGYFIEFSYVYPTPVSIEVFKIQKEIERRTRNHLDSILLESPPHPNQLLYRFRVHKLQQKKKKKMTKKKNKSSSSSSLLSEEYLRKEKVTNQLDSFFIMGSIKTIFEKIFLQQQQQSQQYFNNNNNKERRSERIDFYKKNVMFMLEWATTPYRTNPNRVYVVCSLLHYLFSFLSSFNNNNNSKLKISLSSLSSSDQKKEENNNFIKEIDLSKLDDIIDQEEKKFDVSGISSIQVCFFQFIEQYCLNFFNDDNNEKQQQQQQQQKGINNNNNNISKKIWNLISSSSSSCNNKQQQEINICLKEEEMKSIIRLYSELFRLGLYNTKQFVENMLVRGYPLFPSLQKNEENDFLFFQEEEEEEEEIIIINKKKKKKKKRKKKKKQRRRRSDDDDDNNNNNNQILSFKILKKLEHPLQFFLVFFSVTAEDEYFKKLYITNYFSPFYENNRNLLGSVESQILSFIKSSSNNPQVPKCIKRSFLSSSSSFEYDEDEDDDDDVAVENEKDLRYKEEEKVMSKWFFLRISKEIIFDRILKLPKFIESLKTHEIHRIINLFLQLSDFSSLLLFLKELVIKHPMSSSSSENKNNNNQQQQQHLHPFLVSLLVQNAELFMVCDETKFLKKQLSSNSRIKFYKSGVYWDDRMVENFRFTYPYYPNTNKNIFSFNNFTGIEDWSLKICQNYLSDQQQQQQQQRNFGENIQEMKNMFLLGNKSPQDIDLNYFQWRCLFLFFYIDNVFLGDNNNNQEQQEQQEQKMKMFERWAISMSIFRVMGFISEKITSIIIKEMIVLSSSSSSSSTTLMSEEIEKNIDFYHLVKKINTETSIINYICYMVSFGGIPDTSMLWNEVVLPLLSLPSPGPPDSIIDLIRILSQPISNSNDSVISFNTRDLHEHRMLYCCLNPNFLEILNLLSGHQNLSLILSKSRKFIELIFYRFQNLFFFANKFSPKTSNNDLTFSIFSRIDLIQSSYDQPSNNWNIFTDLALFLNHIHINEWNQGIYSLLLKVMIEQWKTENPKSKSFILAKLLISKLPQTSSLEVINNSSSSFSSLKCYSQVLSRHNLPLHRTIEEVLYSTPTPTTTTNNRRRRNRRNIRKEEEEEEESQDIDLRPFYFLFLHYSSQQPEFATKIFRFVLDNLKKCLEKNNNRRRRYNNNNNDNGFFSSSNSPPSPQQKHSSDNGNNIEWKKIVFYGYLLIRLVVFVDEYGLSESTLQSLWECYNFPSLRSHFSGRDELAAKNLLRVEDDDEDEEEEEESLLSIIPPPPPLSTNNNNNNERLMIERWDGSIRTVVIGNLNLVWNVIKMKCHDSPEIKDNFQRFIRGLQNDRNSVKKEEERQMELSNNNIITLNSFSSSSTSQQQQQQQQQMKNKISLSSLPIDQENWIHLEGYQAECSGCGVKHSMKIPRTLNDQKLPVRRLDHLNNRRNKSINNNNTTKVFSSSSSSSSSSTSSLMNLRNGNNDSSSGRSDVSVTEEDEEEENSDNNNSKLKKKKKKKIIIKSKRRSIVNGGRRRGKNKNKLLNLDIVMSFPTNLRDEWSDQVVDSMNEENNNKKKIIPPPPPLPPIIIVNSKKKKKKKKIFEKEEEEEYNNNNNDNNLSGKKRKRSSLVDDTDEDNIETNLEEMEDIEILKQKKRKID